MASRMINSKLILSYHILAPLHFFFFFLEQIPYSGFFSPPSFELFLFQYLSLGTLKKCNPQFHYHTQK